jgi:gamma-glutamyltranspeptidase
MPCRRADRDMGEPIAGTYRDVTVYETPAPTQGFTVLG